MRIEVSIDRLVVNGRIAGSADELLAALTGELRHELARELGQLSQLGRRTGARAITVPRLRAALTLPPSGAGAGAAGRAIGATLASAVTSDRVLGTGTPRTSR